MKRIVIDYGLPFCTLRKGLAKRILPALQVEDPKAVHRKRAMPWAAHAMSDKVLFFDYETKQFPFGLLPDVRRLCRDQGYVCKVLYPNGKPKELSTDGLSADMLYGVSMDGKRDYQLESAIRAVSERCGWLWLATNAGKSIVMAAVAKYMWERYHYPVTIVVPNAGLLLQLSKEIQELIGEENKVGIVGNGKRIEGVVTVATAQTLIKGVPRFNRRLRKVAFDPFLNKLLRRTKVFMVDEGHHASADTWQQLLGYVASPVRLGFSGTVKDATDPVKDFTLRAYLGPVLMRVKNKELIKRGISAKPVVYLVTASEAYQTDCTAEMWERTKSGKYKLDDKGRRIMREGRLRYQEERTALLGDKHYNGAVVSITQAFTEGGLKPLIVSSSIPHITKKLEPKLLRKNLVPLPVWGGIPPRERIEALGRFNREDNTVLIGSAVVDEGFNVPAIGVMILTSGDKSNRQQMQRIGRSLRAKKRGPNLVAIVDMMAHNGNILAKHSAKRAEVYRREGFEVVEVSDVYDFCSKARKGWKGLLGVARFKKLVAQAEKTRLGS